MNGSPPTAVVGSLRKRFGVEFAFMAGAGLTGERVAGLPAPAVAAPSVHHRQRAGTAPVPLLARASCGAPSDPLPTLS